MGPESESVELLPFKRMETDIPDRPGVVGSRDGGVGGVLVHQVRYMIFDNRKLYFFPYC